MRLPTVPPGPLWTTGLLSFCIVVLWQFPALWYTASDNTRGFFWLTEQTQLTNWTFDAVPIQKAAEAVLVADRLVNGQFRRSDGKVVHVFLAKRYVESQSEIGLFAHTPDRCWTESGWKLDPSQPEFKKILIHGMPLLVERRVFLANGQRELVYFAGLVGGQPLPYRLDHNLSVGMRHALDRSKDETGTTLRASDKRFWERVWQAFLARRRLIGPKQFIRVSAPVGVEGLDAADALLEEFLPSWLQLADYQDEIQQWQHKSGKVATR